MIDIVVQILIGGCGIMTIFMTTSASHEVRRRACFIGMFVQPFWFYTTFVNEQWGVLVLSVVYMYRWVQVFVRDWIKGG